MSKKICFKAKIHQVFWRMFYNIISGETIKFNEDNEFTQKSSQNAGADVEAKKQEQ